MGTTRPLGPLVLVVDDSSTAADSLALALRRWGYRATVAYDGPAALALASAEPPAAMLLDLGLPGMDGRWRTTATNPAAPGQSSSARSAASSASRWGRGNSARPGLGWVNCSNSTGPTHS